ncbi:MAG: glycoside hydrolase family 43 protein, partial [Rikenellaceae bacterium]
EHKVQGDEGNRAQVGVGCYSSEDLYTWKNEGIALAVVENDTLNPISKGCILERPKVVFNKKTGKYVMWFHLEILGQGYKAANYGVAVADKITGPYSFVTNGRSCPGILPINAPEKNDTLTYIWRDLEGGQMARDQTIFVDDDNKAYHIFSSEENATTHIAELSDDYLSHTGKYKRLFLNRSMEAPAICKRNGKYYFIGSGCTGWAPNKARMAYSTDLFGQWTELENPCKGEGSDKTFGAQSTYIIKVADKPDTYIFCADIWRPKDARDGRYLWLPMKWNGDQIEIEYQKEWSL